MRTIFGVLICLTIATTAMAKQKDTAGSAELDPFAGDHVWKIHLRVTERQWQMMQPNRRAPMGAIFANKVQPTTRKSPPTTQATTQQAATSRPAKQPHVEGEHRPPGAFGLEFSYVKATFEFEGEKYEDVGLRLKGNSSYTASTASMKRPYKVDFTHFTKGRLFHGNATINLNNNAYDASYLRETLSFATFRAAGVPAPRTTFAAVYLTIDGKCDREYLGIYTIIEEVDDKEFLKREFGSAKGLLLKPERIRGLPFLGEDWAGYEPRYRPKTEGSVEAQRQVIELTRLVSYADDATFRQKIESLMNVEEFVRFLAVEVLLANGDSILVTGHNYYIYVNPRDNKRIHWMPWDMNLSFANYGSIGSEQQQMAFSISRPNTDWNRIIDRVLAIPAYRQLYHRQLRQLAENDFRPDRMSARIDALRQLVDKADAAAFAASARKMPQTMPIGWQGRVSPDLKMVVNRRVESVLAQLAGREDGYTPSFNRGGFFNAFNRRRFSTILTPEAMARVLLHSAAGQAKQTMTYAELCTTIHAFFLDADRDNKGSLDEQTMTARFTNFLAPPAPTTRPAGAGSTRGHWTWTRGQATPTAADLAALLASSIIKDADNDQDGHVSQDDLMISAKRIFLEADRNWDGELDATETLDAIGRLAPSDRR